MHRFQFAGRSLFTWLIIYFFAFSASYANEQVLPPRNDRIATGETIFREMQKLSDQMSQPSPEDLEWVQREGAAISRLPSDSIKKARDTKYLSSPRFHHVRLYYHLEETLAALRCANRTDASIQVEMHCWALASLLLGQRDIFVFSINALLKSGHLPGDLYKRLDRASMAGIPLLIDIYGRTLTRNFVIPYLAQQAQGIGKK